MVETVAGYMLIVKVGHGSAPDCGEMNNVFPAHLLKVDQVDAAAFHIWKVWNILYGTHVAIEALPDDKSHSLKYRTKNIAAQE